MKRHLLIVAALLFIAAAAPAARAQTITENLGEITVTNPHARIPLKPELKPAKSKGWMFAVYLGMRKQPKCCYQWDHLAPEKKVGKQHIHGDLGKMKGIDVQTFTDPQSSVSMGDCESVKDFCFPAGSEKLKEKGTRACGSDPGKSFCNRACGDGEVQSCSSYCCKAKCGCAHCD